MIETIDPKAAHALIAARDPELEIIDVRERREWLRGHVPGARLLPLDELRASPQGKLRTKRVLFVCARGVRSLSAAKVAEAFGLPTIYSLDGGTAAWVDAGLPVVVEPDELEPDSTPEPIHTEPHSIPEAGMPALDAVVGTNLAHLREQRGMGLDALARLTGLSRSLLGQIENGRTAPSVSVVWKIAGAFGVPFSSLLATTDAVETCLLRQATAKRLVSADGRFSSRALFPLGAHSRVEFYELWLAPHGVEQAEAHAPGTQENLIVTAGRLDLQIAGERYTLAKGDAIVFLADVPHSYTNPDNQDCWMNLVMTYAR